MRELLPITTPLPIVVPEPISHPDIISAPSPMVVGSSALSAVMLTCSRIEVRAPMAILWLGCRWEPIEAKEKMRALAPTLVSPRSVT